MMRSKQQQGKLQQMQAFLHANTRSLHQRLILVTIVVLLLSGLVLLHSLAFKHTSEAAPAVAREPTTTLPPVSFAALSQQVEEKKRKPFLVDLTPPLSRQTLGHATWAMLHTMAALYPEDPSLAKQAAMRSFIEALGELYPCATCARHFRTYLSEHPLPSPLTHGVLAQWLCESHNAVNVRLDKTPQECTPLALATKWPPKLEQDCGCNASDEDEATTPALVTTPAVSTQALPVKTRSLPKAAALPPPPLPPTEAEEEEQALLMAYEEEQRRKANEQQQSEPSEGVA